MERFPDNLKPSYLRLAVACATLVCLGMATGCNNGKQLQRDLYQRELRLQEDEIYRLEDYIEQYQAIIREYRCKNAELEQQLGDGGPNGSSSKLRKLDDGAERSVLDGSGGSSPLDSPYEPSGTSGPAGSQRESQPRELAPIAPEPPSISTGEPTDPPGIEIPEINMGEPVGPADVSPPETSIPAIDIPEPSGAGPGTGGALETTPSSRYDLPSPTPAAELLPSPSTGSSRSEAPPFRSAGSQPAPTNQNGQQYAAPAELPPHPASIAPLTKPSIVRQPAREASAEALAVLELPAAEGVATTLAPATFADEQSSDQLTLDDLPVVIESASLEITAKQLPRLSTGEQQILVNVTPHSIRGDVLEFVGSASLMLRDSRVDTQIARWDYSIQEVENAWSSQDDGHNDGLDFVLILPNGVPQSRPLELWVRLLDEASLDGNDKKLLENISVRLSKLELSSLESASEPEATFQAASQSGDKDSASLPNAEQVRQADWSSVQQSQEVIPTSWEAPTERAGSRVRIKQDGPK